MKKPLVLPGVDKKALANNILRLCKDGLATASLHNQGELFGAKG
jgi:hypothetical protein